MKKKTILIIVVIFILIISLSSNSTISNIRKDVADKMENLTNKNNKFVLMVKNGYPETYPNSTYGEAFQNFFGSTTWKHFESTDGKDIVEFTGECTYQNEQVKTRIQFIVNLNNKTFENGAFTLNEISQSQLLANLFIDKVFKNEKSDTKQSSKSTENTNPITNKDSSTSNASDVPSTKAVNDSTDLFTYFGKTKTDIIKDFGEPNKTEGVQAGYIYYYANFYFYIVDDNVVAVNVTGSIVTVNGIKIGMLPKDTKSKNGKPSKEGTDSEGFFMDYRISSDRFSIKYYSNDSSSPIKSIYACELEYVN